MEDLSSSSVICECCIIIITDIYYKRAATEDAHIAVSLMIESFCTILDSIQQSTAYSAKKGDFGINSIRDLHMV